jgi:polyhydroxyalkanoate synthesis regulator phasin
LKNELIKTGEFSKEESAEFLKDAVSQRIIYEGENGFYATN